jgi:ligand-binding sensor domain-containing protein
MRFGIIFCVTLFAVPFASLAQSLPFINYTIENGLPQSTVFTTYQDQQGYLWIGTQGGATRFDGTTFQTWDSQVGLIDNHVTAIAQGSDGTIWLGHRTGALTYLREDRLYEFSHAVFDNTYYINQLLWNGEALYVATEGNGLFILSFDKGDTTVQHFTKKQGALPSNSLNKIISYNASNLLIATGAGMTLFNLARNNFTSLHIPSAHQQDVTAICLASDGSLWFDSNKDLVNIDLNNPKKGQKIFTAANGLGKVTINDIKEDRKGNIWMATDKGLMTYDHGEISWLTKENGLLSDKVYAILFDREDNVWLSQDDGLSQYIDVNFSLFTQHDGLINNKVYSVIQDDKNTYWIGTAEGISVFTPSEKLSDRFRNVTTKDGLPGNFVHNLFKDSRGNIWVGTLYDGAARYDASNGRFTRFGSQQGLEGKRVISINEDSQGRIWLASLDKGLAVYDYNTGKIRNFNTQHGFVSDRVWTIYKDSQQRLWFGSNEHGLIYLDIKSDSLKVVPGQEALANKSFGSLSGDSQDNIWIASIGGGVFKYDGKKFMQYGVNKGLTSTNPYFVFCDDADKVWLGTNVGVEVFDPQSKKVKRYGKNDGFMGIETNQNAIYKDLYKNLWIGTVNGLMLYRNDTTLENEEPPLVHITQQKLFMKDTLFVQDVSLPYDQNYLTFNFLGISLAQAEKVRYSYKLEGFDQAWSPTSSSPYVTYTNLPAGYYTFKVRAGFENGSWNEKAATFSFHIQPPFWKTWWFIYGALILSAIILIVLFRLRVKYILKEERKVAAFKLQVAELKMETLRTQMNPHFIFNTLNSIQYFTATNDRQSAIEYLGKFGSLMRQILDNSVHSYIKLTEELAMVENYIALEHLRLENSFDYEIKIDEAAPVQNLEIPPMLIQPYVENAILHGLKHQTRKRGKLIVHVVLQQEGLQCIIEDNGIGRKKSTELKSTRHRSVATELTQRRFDILQQTSSYQNARVEIIDLGEADNPLGTRVILMLPKIMN